MANGLQQQAMNEMKENQIALVGSYIKEVGI